jgi:transcription termination/antitermination protein NusG
MSQQIKPTQSLDDSHPRTLAPKWHVIWTRSHSEQMLHDDLRAKGFDPFLPQIDIWLRRHGMRHRGTVPMFPGYLFLHHHMDQDSYLAVAQSRGVVKLLGEGWDRLATVPEVEIEAIRKIHAAHAPAAPHRYLREGQRVRLIDGLLAGLEGILLRTKPNKGLLVVSVELLQRSVAVEIDCTLVVPA